MSSATIPIPLCEPLEQRVDFVAMHRLRPERYPFILESAAHGTPQGRFDILFAFPQDEISLWADEHGLHGKRDFLDELDGRLDVTAADTAAQSYAALPQLPFYGGWFVYLGYELAAQIEPLLTLPLPTGMPTAYAVRIPVALVYSHQSRQTWLVMEPSFAGCQKDLRKDLARVSSRAVTRRPLLENPLVADPPEAFIEAVVRAKRHIIDGDVFQANLSRAWRGAVVPSWHDAEMYRRLRKANPGPFAGLAVWQNLAIISSSPERLIRLHAGHIDTRPIAGTRPRGALQHQDAALSRELIGHPKERAEHVMLIDLERNDLGRVCKPGTVNVNELMVIESYTHVHHIVSNIEGVLCDDVTPGAAIRATFPGGTITGCPKVRCMEIIAKLERTPRGPYTGSMGYLNHDGSGDLNILIRSIVRSGNELSLRAGAGIVADSDPQKELEETGFKAKGLIRALASDADHHEQS